MKNRKEYDSIGGINVPVDKYWGASTQRSSKYFDIGDFLVRPIVIKSIAIIKKAAAIVNAKNGDLDKKISKTIVKAANEVISGKLINHFPLYLADSACACNPSDKAIEFIQKTEPFSREWYAGPVGMISNNHSLALVAIRSGIINHQKISLYAGAGIINASHPNKEWDELNTKIHGFKVRFKP